MQIEQTARALRELGVRVEVLSDLRQALDLLRSGQLDAVHLWNLGRPQDLKFVLNLNNQRLAQMELTLGDNGRFEAFGSFPDGGMTKDFDANNFDELLHCQVDYLDCFLNYHYYVIVYLDMLLNLQV